MLISTKKHNNDQNASTIQQNDALGVKVLYLVRQYITMPLTSKLTTSAPKLSVSFAKRKCGWEKRKFLHPMLHQYLRQERTKIVSDFEMSR
jgi:hypothetical protein